MKTIAIIEDHPEIRNSLVELIQINGYNTISAQDGKEGLALIKRSHPDLIVTDIMMPQLDGFDLVKELRSNERYHDIPIIFLTARVTMSDKLKGLEYGANDYITKPFEIRELLLKIKNLLQLQENTRQEKDTTPVIESQDQRFIRSVQAAIDEQIENVELGLPDLASALEISTSTLQKKLKRIEEKSVSQYIREYRLKRAKDLIEADYGSLSDIAHKMGFRNLSYFSRTYNQFYGIAPSKVQKK